MTNLLLSTSMGIIETLKTSGLGFGLVLIVLAVLAIFVMLLSSFFRKDKKKTDESTDVAIVSGADSLATNNNSLKAPVITETNTAKPVYTGYVTLDSVSEQDAAVIMAITSHKTGIPLERLGFCSIKLKSPELINVTEQDAAAVMAITSHKTGIPLENLYFKSIKLLED